jgi:hypothetical protein
MGDGTWCHHYDGVCTAEQAIIMMMMIMMMMMMMVMMQVRAAIGHHRAAARPAQRASTEGSRPRSGRPTGWLTQG